MIYDAEQVMKAAEFIWNNNKHVGLWPSQPQSSMDVMRQMLYTAQKQGMKNMGLPTGQWVGWLGSGGYYMIFTSEGEDQFEVEFLVDANVGGEHRYVEEWIDEDTY